tara:strand:+ start:516 stop:737 length:222 start_codon:yes stop_codon:yes gene_type:complete
MVTNQCEGVMSEQADSGSFIPGCKLCRALNDGLCDNYCAMDKAQRVAFMQENKHLFRSGVPVQSMKQGESDEN